MKKSTIVSIVFASLLISPVILARHVQAEEVAANSQEPALTSHVGQPSTAEASPVSNEVPASSELSPKEDLASQTSLDQTTAETGPTTIQPTTGNESSPTKETAVVEKAPVQPTSDAPQSAELPVAEKNPLPVSNASKVTLGELSEVTGQPVAEQDVKKEATVIEAVNQLLNWAATKENQVGSTDKDRLAFAKSLGMVK